MPQLWSVCVALIVIACCARDLLVRAVTSPMPYRPGYGLGSWMPPEVITGMKQEAFLRTQILLSTNMDSVATSLARELQITMAGINNGLNSQQTIPTPMTPERAKQFMNRITQRRTDAWKAKVQAYRQLFAGMRLQLSQLSAAASGGGGGMTGTAKGAFSTFANGIQSPIDWTLSKIVMKDRSFDSINIDSHYIRVDNTVQSADSSAHARAVADSSSDSWSIFFGLFKFESTSSAASSVQSKVSRTMAMKNVEATLVLSAFATHRHVKQFESVHLVPQSVRDAWNFYFKDSRIPDPEVDMIGFEQAYAQALADDNSDKGDRTPAQTLNLLTEIYQGSAMIGLVHFVKREKSSSSQSSSSSSQATADSLRAHIIVVDITKRSSYAESAASEIAKMASDAGLDIQFDLVVVGYAPKIKSQTLKFAVSSFANFDPSAFDAGAIMTDASASALQQGAQQSGMDAVIHATVQSLNEVEQDNPVLGIQTFMDAFDDYAEACKSSQVIGAPVGMNVKPFTKMDVMKLLAKKYLTPGQAAGESVDVG